MGVIKALVVLVLALCLGGGWALNGLSSVDESTSFMKYNGPWRVNPSMDLTDIKQRALIAKVGLFALRETEVVYYTATIDSDGRPLTSEYDYMIEGSVPAARYWSYTLYGSDDFLIPNSDKIYGYNQRTIQYTPVDHNNPELSSTGQPTYRMYMSSSPSAEENWLPSGDNIQLALTLRLYNPSPEVYEHLTTIPLPTIKRVL